MAKNGYETGSSGSPMTECAGGGRCILVCAGEYATVRDAGWRLQKKPGDLVIAVDRGLLYLEQEGVEPDVILGDFDSIRELLPTEEKAEREDLDSVENTPFAGVEPGDRDLAGAADAPPQSVGVYPDLKRHGQADIITLPVAKDDTDTMSAARYGIEKGYRTFLIYGGLGGRLDHTVANIQTLVWIQRQGGQGWLVEDGRRATVIGTDGKLYEEGAESILEDGVGACKLNRTDTGAELVLPASFDGTVSLFSLDRVLRGVYVQGTLYDVENAEIRNDFPVGCSNEKRAGKEASIRFAEGTALVVLIDGLMNTHGN